MTGMLIDPTIMTHCIKLARQGRRLAAPNPMVGAAVVHEGRIIGEGWHRRYGESHAEANAINTVADHSVLSKASLYITLEPCCHHGKTPPCTELILSSKIPQVVVATRDPSRKVNGAGIDLLRSRGVSVEEGILQAEARGMNRRFITFHEKRRPYVILKWAQTSDGYIAQDDMSSRWISGEESRAMVHEWRSEEGAIMVGTSTALHDNPQLTARPSSFGELRQPVRIVIDKSLKLASDLNLFDRSTRTIIVNEQREHLDRELHWAKVDFHKDVIAQTLRLLHDRSLLSLFVEGGARLLQSFIAQGVWDEARVFTSTKKFGSGIKAPLLPTASYKELTVGEDNLAIYRNCDFIMNEFTNS